jgi:hypothetical protein
MNPYTGEKMKTVLTPFEGKSVDLASFKKWMTNALSDFTNKIHTEKDFKLYVQNKEEKDINKVLIFTRRENIAPTIKTLSAVFRDRLRISIVHVPENKNKQSDFTKELMKDYEIESVPKLLVEQTYDPKEDKVLAQYGIHDYKQKDFKIDQLIEFLEPFARK